MSEKLVPVAMQILDEVRGQEAGRVLDEVLATRASLGEARGRVVGFRLGLGCEISQKAAGHSQWMRMRATVAESRTLTVDESRTLTVDESRTLIVDESRTLIVDESRNQEDGGEDRVRMGMEMRMGMGMEMRIGMWSGVLAG